MSNEDEARGTGRTTNQLKDLVQRALTHGEVFAYICQGRMDYYTELAKHLVNEAGSLYKWCGVSLQLIIGPGSIQFVSGDLGARALDLRSSGRKIVYDHAYDGVRL